MNSQDDLTGGIAWGELGYFVFAVLAFASVIGAGVMVFLGMAQHDREDSDGE